MYGSISPYELDELPYLTVTSLKDLPNQYVPAFWSNNRQTGVGFARFQILATLVDGTLLSLPWAISKCGLLVGILVILGVHLATMCSCSLIKILATKMGKATISELVEICLGKNMRRIFSVALFFVLLLLLVGFMTLIRDITFDVSNFFQLELHGASGLVMVIYAALLTPLMLQRNLKALRLSCACGLIAISGLLVILSWKTASSISRMSGQLPNIRLGPKHWHDVLAAVPIINVVYLCQFNILGVHATLKEPTDERLDSVTHGALCIITSFYLIFGIVCYVLLVLQFEGSEVDNILSLFAPDDTLLLVGRLMLLVALLAVIPMIMLPTRNIWITEIQNPIFRMRAKLPETRSNEVQYTPTKIEKPQLGEYLDYFGVGLAGLESIWREWRASGESTFVSNTDAGSILMQLPGSLKGGEVDDPSWLVLSLATFFLTVVIVLAALYMPYVSLVWTVLGSTLSIFTVYFVPAHAFLAFAQENKLAWDSFQGK
jgi:amino acid permease